jgi:hypothetical protein
MSTRNLPGSKGQLARESDLIVICDIAFTTTTTTTIIVIMTIIIIMWRATRKPE